MIVLFFSDMAAVLNLDDRIKPIVELLRPTAASDFLVEYRKIVKNEKLSPTGKIIAISKKIEGKGEIMKLIRLLMSAMYPNFKLSDTTFGKNSKSALKNLISKLQYPDDYPKIDDYNVYDAAFDMTPIWFKEPGESSFETLLARVKKFGYDLRDDTWNDHHAEWNQWTLARDISHFYPAIAVHIAPLNMVTYHYRRGDDCWKLEFKQICQELLDILSPKDTGNRTKPALAVQPVVASQICLMCLEPPEFCTC